MPRRRSQATSHSGVVSAAGAAAMLVLLVLPLLLTQVGALPPGAEGASASKLRSLGETAMVGGQYDQAAELYKKVIQIEPNDARNYYKLFRVHLRQQKYKNAVQVRRCLARRSGCCRWSHASWSLPPPPPPPPLPSSMALLVVAGCSQPHVRWSSGSPHLPLKSHTPGPGPSCGSRSQLHRGTHPACACLRLHLRLRWRVCARCWHGGSHRAGASSAFVMGQTYPPSHAPPPTTTARPPSPQGKLQTKLGRCAEAVRSLERALKLEPNNDKARGELPPAQKCAKALQVRRIGLVVARAHARTHTPTRSQETQKHTSTHTRTRTRTYTHSLIHSHSPHVDTRTRRAAGLTLVCGGVLRYPSAVGPSRFTAPVLVVAHKTTTPLGWVHPRCWWLSCRTRHGLSLCLRVALNHSANCRRRPMPCSVATLRPPRSSTTRPLKWRRPAPSCTCRRWV